MSLNSTPGLAEDKDIEMFIITSITILKRSSKKCGTNEVLEPLQSYLDSDITRGTFDEPLRNMFEINAVKIQTIRDRECLSLSREEPKDLNMTKNWTIND